MLCVLPQTPPSPRIGDVITQDSLQARGPRWGSGSFFTAVGSASARAEDVTGPEWRGSGLLRTQASVISYERREGQAVLPAKGPTLLPVSVGTSTLGHFEGTA